MVAAFVGVTDGSSGVSPWSVTMHADTEIGHVVSVGFRFTGSGHASTPPSGWTLGFRYSSVSMNATYESWWRISAEAGAYTADWSIAAFTGVQWTATTWSDTNGLGEFQYGETSGTSVTAVTRSMTSTERILAHFGLHYGATTATPDGASNTRLTATTTPYRIGVYDKVGGPGLVTGTSLALSQSTPAFWANAPFLCANVAPNAPTLISLTGGVGANRANVNRASWTFSDDDAGDSQSKFTLDWTLDGVAQTPITQITPNGFYDFPAGSPAGDVEWGVITYDNASPALASPRSTSGHFTFADMPTGATITAPINGATVDRLTTMTWSVPDQDEFQVQRTSVDGLTIHYDSGEVAEPATRSLALDFETNNQTEKLRIRIKEDGLWTDWASIEVDVSYSPPATPEFEIQLDPAFGRLVIPVGNPTPGAGEQAAEYNNVYVDDGKGKGFELKPEMANLSPNTTAYYSTPVSGRPYTGNIYVEAVAANGATARSL